MVSRRFTNGFHGWVRDGGKAHLARGLKATRQSNPCAAAGLRPLEWCSQNTHGQNARAIPAPHQAMSPPRYRSNPRDTSETVAPASAAVLCALRDLEIERGKTTRPSPLHGNETNAQPPITVRLCGISIKHQTFSGTSGVKTAILIGRCTSTLNSRLTVFIAPFLIGQCT